MSKKWILWKGIDLSKNNQKGYISSKKFKISIFLFSIIFLLSINLKIIEVLSLADGKVIPQGRIKFVQHLREELRRNTYKGVKVNINQPLVVLSKEELFQF